jgi:hypothetical protein
MINNFPIIILIGRPAAGKSEIIKYLKETPVDQRSRRFHIGSFFEIDDFPMLWTWFEEDKILEELGRPRLHTDAEGFFKEHYLWDLLIRRIELDYHKTVRDNPDSGTNHTAILEFSRGREHGGFTSAFKNLTQELLKKAAVLYIDVSYEESHRKNRRRFNPDKPDSVLEHGLPDDKMKKLYEMSDWEELASGDPEYLYISETKVPYAVFKNGDDATTKGGEILGNRLEEVLNVLWQRAGKA